MKAITTQGAVTIQLASAPLSLEGAKWHLLEHIPDDPDTDPLEERLQHELTRQLSLNKDKKHSSYSWRVLQEVKDICQATKFHGDTALTIPPFFQNASRGNERIWGEKTTTPQPKVINWGGLNKKEQQQLEPILPKTHNWILLTQPRGENNKTRPPLGNRN